MSLILLADDNSLARNMGRQILAEEGHEVVVASDGGEALRFLEERSPEIVIVETSLPGTSGLDICRHIKSNPNLNHVKVVLLAGPRETVGELELSEARSDGILHKPLDPGTVSRTVQALSVGETLRSDTADQRADNPSDQPVESDGSHEAHQSAEQAEPFTAGSQGDGGSAGASNQDSPRDSADPFAAVVEHALRERTATNLDRRQVRRAVAEVMEAALPAIIERVTDRVLGLLAKQNQSS